MNHSPQPICPRCESPIQERHLESRGNMPAIIDQEIVEGEWVEHRPKGGCGKWLWRRKKEAA